jgi:hypothetical protein
MRTSLIWVMMLVAPGAMAANCGSTNSQAELQNVPAQEMQGYRSVTKANECISAAQFTARPKAKTPAGSVASSSGSSKPVTTAKPDGGAYVPKTKDDNTPYRFDMNQNGKRMTADEFAAWMKAKGIHVATGKPGGPAVAQPTPTPAEPACKPTKRKKCK